MPLGGHLPKGVLAITSQAGEFLGLPYVSDLATQQRGGLKTSSVRKEVTFQLFTYMSVVVILLL